MQDGRRRGGSVGAIGTFQDAEEGFEGVDERGFRARERVGGRETVFTLLVIARCAVVERGPVREKTLAALPHVHACCGKGGG